MKCEELKMKLAEMKDPDIRYSIGGSSDIMDKAYNLIREKNGWEVFFLDEGIQRGYHVFPKEEDACDFLMELIIFAGQEHPAYVTQMPKYLPLGSIVSLKDNPVKLMIIARALQAKNPRGEINYFDYAAVIYPHGLMNEQLIYFQRDSISMVYFLGFRDADEVAVRNVLAKYEKENESVPRGKPEDWEQ